VFSNNSVLKINVFAPDLFNSSRIKSIGSSTCSNTSNAVMALNGKKEESNSNPFA
jgi:hypothetical protein